VESRAGHERVDDAGEEVARARPTTQIPNQDADVVRSIRITVCELSDDRRQFDDDWRTLVAHARAESSQLVLLPEMPFAPWLAVSSQFDPAAWNAAVAAHESWLARLPEVAPAAVLGSRPVTRAGVRLNEGFAWDATGGLRAVHDKCFLPDEAGYWEAKWYAPGNGRFDLVTIAGARVGLQICTELWSLGHAQAYGRAGAEIIAIPRATGKPTVEKWLVGGRAAAIVSGAYSISSNWSADDRGGDFGGAGWIVDPDGRELARTTRAERVLTVTIDLDLAVAAKATYPRYSIG
jgi:N-carbamoylputrescine amidase